MQFINVIIETFHNDLYCERLKHITINMYLKYFEIMFRKYLHNNSKINVSKLTNNTRKLLNVSDMY